MKDFVCSFFCVSLGLVCAAYGHAEQCPENSTYTTCGYACPGTCRNWYYPPICANICVPGCQCDEGYVLDGDKCVQKIECSEPPDCRVNEYFGWGNNCHKCGKIYADCSEVNRFGCFCKPGFKYDEHSSTCILENQCY